MSMTSPATKPTTEGGNQTRVAARYLGSNALGALTLAAVLAGISPENAQLIIAKLHVMYQATQDFIGAFSQIWFIIFPVISGWLLKMGVNSASFGNMMARLLSAAKSGNVQAQALTINATGELLASPATTPLIAAPTKVALLDATASLPEVVGDIKVTDKTLADATVSPQVVKGT